MHFASVYFPDKSRNMGDTYVVAVLSTLQTFRRRMGKTFFRSAFYAFCVNVYGINLAGSPHHHESHLRLV